MFYIRVPLSDAVSLCVKIRTGCVFTRCACCGREMTVDLADVFANGVKELENTDVLCRECAELLTERLGKP